jgi:hypothetical protein
MLLPVLVVGAAGPGLAGEVDDPALAETEQQPSQDSTGLLRLSVAGLSEDVSSAGAIVVRGVDVPSLNLRPVRRRVPFTGQLEVALPAGNYLVEYTSPPGFVVSERTVPVAITAGVVASLEFQLVTPGTEETETPTEVAPAPAADSIEANDAVVTDSAPTPGGQLATDSPPRTATSPLGEPGAPPADTAPPVLPEPVKDAGYAEILIYTGRSGDQIFVDTEFMATTPDIVIVPAGLVRFRVIGPTGSAPVCEWRTEIVKEVFRCFRCDPETGRAGSCPSQ